MNREEDIQNWLEVNRRLETEISALRNVLDQAQLTLSLLNDILKNKGDSSHDGFVQQLLVRIDRLLNPVYIVESPLDKKETQIKITDEYFDRRGE